MLKCEDCGKSFSCKSNLKAHINTVHKGERKFQCEDCDKSFSQKGNLNRHINTVHKGENDFKIPAPKKRKNSTPHSEAIKRPHKKLYTQQSFQNLPTDNRRALVKYDKNVRFTSMPGIANNCFLFAVLYGIQTRRGFINHNWSGRIMNAVNFENITAELSQDLSNIRKHVSINVENRYSIVSNIGNNQAEIDNLNRIRSGGELGLGNLGDIMNYLRRENIIFQGENYNFIEFSTQNINGRDFLIRDGEYNGASHNIGIWNSGNHYHVLQTNDYALFEASSDTLTLVELIQNVQPIRPTPPSTPSIVGDILDMQSGSVVFPSSPINQRYIPNRSVSPSPSQASDTFTSDEFNSINRPYTPNRLDGVSNMQSWSVSPSRSPSPINQTDGFISTPPGSPRPFSNRLTDEDLNLIKSFSDGYIENIVVLRDMNNRPITNIHNLNNSLFIERISYKKKDKFTLVVPNKIYGNNTSYLFIVNTPQSSKTKVRLFNIINGRPILFFIENINKQLLSIIQRNFNIESDEISIYSYIK